MLFLGTLFALLVSNGLCAPESAEEKVKDFDYKLDSGRFYALQISTSGSSLVVGSVAETTLKETDYNTIMECRMSDQRNDYHDSFMPRIAFKDNSGGIWQKDNFEFHDNFLFKKKEVWQCNDETTGLLRIVNEAIGIKEVLLVTYTDGVEVFSKSLSTGKNTVLIREIKYIDVFGTVVRYDGLFKLRETKAHPDFFIPDLQSNLRIIPRTEVAADSFKEVIFQDKTFEYQKISKTDSTLIVGERINRVYTGSSELGCRKYQGANPFPFTLRPVTKLTIEGKDVIVTKENYLDYFTPIKDEIWVCKATNEDQLLRIVNEFVSQIEIGNIIVHDEVIELRKVKLMRKSGVRIKTVRYYNASAHENPMTKYEGTIKILDPEDNQMAVLQNYAEQIGSPMKEVVYHLHKERAFKAIVSARGMSVRLGTPWKTIIGKVNDVVTCRKHPKGPFMPEYSTQFRLILRIHEKQFLKALPKSKHLDYWEYTKQEVWTCEKSDMNYRFLRIVNELKGLDELNEVEYTDGIQLYNRALSENRRSINVIEIKYIDPNTFDALMYPGKLILENSEGSPLKYEFKCFNCDGQPIRKTEDSIYFGVGRRKDKFAFDNRVQGVIYKLQKDKSFAELWDTESKVALSVDFGFETTVGRIVDLVECVPSNSIRGTNIEDYKPAINLINRFNIISWACLDKKTIQELGIQFGETKAWLCQNSELKFYRLEGTVIFTKPIKKLYYIDGATVNPIKDGDRITKITVKFVQYQNVDSIQRLRYEGDVILLPPLEDQDLMCGTVAQDRSLISTFLEREHSDGQEVIYKLDMRRYHKLDVFREYKPTEKKTERNVFVIGEHYKKQIGTATTSATCEKTTGISVDTFRSKYLTHFRKLNNNNHGRQLSETRIDQSTVFDHYFKFKSHEIWNCTFFDTNEQKQMFNRVINVFLYHINDNKLDDIWYYDGITIATGAINTQKVLLITEIRYLDLDEKEVRFDGLINLKITNTGQMSKYYKARLRLISRKKMTPIPQTEATLMGKASFGVHYELGKRFLYKSVLGMKGSRLKVGGEYDEVMPNPSYFQRLGCDYHPGKLNFNSVSMKIEQGVEDKNSLFKYRIIDPDKFFSISQQIWECRDDNLPDRRLYRVLNTVEAKPGLSIAEVLHHDGVTVHLDGKNITEVKYINPTTGKVVRFDGYIYYISNPPSQPDLSQGEKAREIFYSLETELIHFRNLRKDGPVVEVGTRWEDYYTGEGDVKCDLFNKVEFQPLFELRILTTTMVKDNKFEQKQMNTVEKDKIFKVERRDAYRCKRNQANAFVKVVNTVVTKVDIATIFHSDGITIWSAESDGRYYIREVKYIDDVLKKVLKFEGKIINIYGKKVDRFEEGTSLEEKQARPFNDEEDTDEIWHKEHQQWIANNRKGNEPLERIKYIPYVLSKYIQLSVGLNIRVGSKWMKEVGNSQQKFLCTPANKEEYDTKKMQTKLIVYQDNDGNVLDEYTLETYFTITRTDVLKCTRGTVSFIRVLTEISGKTGVRRIYYVSGVKVFAKTLNTYVNTAHIIELKLMDPADGYKVVKFEGRLEMKNP